LSPYLIMVYPAARIHPHILIPGFMPDSWWPGVVIVPGIAAAGVRAAAGTTTTCA
jgi:hypothetical protein